MSDVTKKRNRWFALGALGVALVAFGVITAGGIGENLVYYWSPSELQKAGDKAYGATIRLGGMVSAGSIQKVSSTALEFDVHDGAGKVHVKAQGVPPQMFREGIGVVVEGTMSRAGHFEGKRLMVSHDNNYQAPKEGQHPDVKQLMETAKNVE